MAGRAVARLYLRHGSAWGVFFSVAAGVAGRTRGPVFGAQASATRLAQLGLAGLVFLGSTAFAQTSVYLDTNGGSSGSGITNGASINWDAGTTSNWTTRAQGANGGAPVKTWSSVAAGTKDAVFSAGGDAGAAYTMNVSGTIANLRNLTFEEGSVTITGGTSLALAATSTVNVRPGLTATINTAISGAGFGLTNAGAGTLTLGGSASNTYTGMTTVKAGTLALSKTGGATALAGNITIGSGSGAATLQLAGSNQIAPSAGVTLAAGGTPVLNLNGFSQQIGSLASSNTNAQVQLGSPGGATTFTVGDSSSTTYAGAITGGANAAFV